MKKIGVILIVLAVVGCARTYNVYNIVKDNSTLTQTIEVTAEVPKTTSVNTDVAPGGILP